MISTTIHLVQMESSVTITSSNYLLAKNHDWAFNNFFLPNCKVQPLLMWMEFIFTIVWMLGVSFSRDEITMRFKGHHTDK